MSKLSIWNQSHDSDRDIWNRAVMEAAQLAARMAPAPDGGNPYNYGERQMADKIARTISSELYVE